MCCLTRKEWRLTVITDCDVTMGRRHCLGNLMTSQWVGDIALDTKQSCDQEL